MLFSPFRFYVCSIQYSNGFLPILLKEFFFFKQMTRRVFLVSHCPVRFQALKISFDPFLGIFKADMAFFFFFFGKEVRWDRVWQMNSFAVPFP